MTECSIPTERHFTACASLAKSVLVWFDDPYAASAASRLGHGSSHGLCASGATHCRAVSPTEWRMGR